MSLRHHHAIQASLTAETLPRDVRVDCPDCADGRNEYGRSCWTCEGAGFWMADVEGEE